MNTWSICESSASVRSPTPLPQSISTSLSRRNEVVRRCRPPIPPEQPKTRRRMALFLVEHRHPVPSGRRRGAALLGDFFGVHAVQVTAGVHAAQIEQRHFGVIPGLRAVLAQRLVPELQFFPDPAIDLALEPDRLVDRHPLVLALHFYAVGLPEYDALHRLA